MSTTSHSYAAQALRREIDVIAGPWTNLPLYVRHLKQRPLGRLLLTVLTAIFGLLALPFRRTRTFFRLVALVGIGFFIWLAQTNTPGGVMGIIVCVVVLMA